MKGSVCVLFPKIKGRIKIHSCVNNLWSKWNENYKRIEEVNDKVLTYKHDRDFHEQTASKLKQAEAQECYRRK